MLHYVTDNPLFSYGMLHGYTGWNRYTHNLGTGGRRFKSFHPDHFLGTKRDLSLSWEVFLFVLYTNLYTNSGTCFVLLCNRLPFLRCISIVLRYEKNIALCQEIYGKVNLLTKFKECQKQIQILNIIFILRDGNLPLFFLLFHI